MKYILAVLLILFASFSDMFLFLVGVIPFQPSSFLIPLFIIISIVTYSIKDFFDLFKSHTSMLFIAFILFSVIYSAFSPASQEVIVMEIALNVITFMLYIFTVQFFRSENKKLGVLVLFISFIILSGSLFYDFFIGLPKFNVSLEEMVRKGGFGGNPNRTASGLKFLALCILAYLYHSKSKRSIFILLMVVSVFFTFSRGGILSIVLILIMGTANNWNSKIQINPLQLFKSVFSMVFLFASLFLILNLLSVVIKENVPAFSRGSAGERLDMLTGQSKKNTVEYEVNLEGSRSDLLLKYSSLFAENPLGYGTGYTTDKTFNPLNTHNQYLYYAVNFGFLAILVYLMYFAYGIKLTLKFDQFYYLIFIVLLLFEGFVTHNIFVNKSVLITLAFFDSLIYKKQPEKHDQNDIEP